MTGRPPGVVLGASASVPDAEEGAPARWLAAYRSALAGDLSSAMSQVAAAFGTDRIPPGPAGIGVVAFSDHRGERDVRHPAEALLSSAGLALWSPAVEAVWTPIAEAADAGSLSTGLAWVRLALSRYLLLRCVRHLREREVGGQPLLRQQLVVADLAEVTADHTQAQAMLGAASGGHDEPGDDVVAAVHAMLTRTDRRLLRLCGGYGYLTDGPGATAAVSELLADLYVARSS